MGPSLAGSQQSTTLLGPCWGDESAGRRRGFWTGRPSPNPSRKREGLKGQKPAGSGQLRPVTAITLNNSPISSGWVRRR